VPTRSSNFAREPDLVRQLRADPAGDRHAVVDVEEQRADAVAEQRHGRKLLVRETSS
jgi:hypothetical protein